jgi:putative salt-induced outer membrane protein
MLSMRKTPFRFGPALAVLAACATPLAAAAQESSAGDAPPAVTAPTLDPGIARMIDTAIARGDDGATAAIFAVARQASPDAQGEIDRREQAWKSGLDSKAARARDERLATLRAAGPLANWKGEVEVGASRSTGSTNNFGLLGSLDLKREGIDWTHKLSARAEVQKTDGQTTAERVVAAWQPNYRFRPRTYAYGLAQYEQDPFAGYDSRATLGGGLGWQAIDGERLKLELEGGPALRRVDPVDRAASSRIAGRGSLSLNWKVTPTLTFSQKTAVYVEGDDGNVVANTALDTKLIGNLKARFSYNVQYERNPPLGTSDLNTQSRATFVYSF